MTTLLPKQLQKSLQEVVSRANMRSANLRAILLSTTDGVPLGRVVAEQDQELNEQVLANIESVWAPASKQIPLLGLDEVKCVTAIYNHGTLLHIYKSAMVITILCGPQANIGAVRSTVMPMLDIVLEPLSRQLETAVPAANYY